MPGSLPPPPMVTQGVAFAFLALTGTAVGLSFDLYRAMRGVRRWPAAPSVAADVAYGLCAGILVAGGLLAATWGEIRAYTVIALTLGGAGYFMLASPAVLPALRVIMRNFYHLGSRILHRLGRPVRWFAGRSRAACRVLRGGARALGALARRARVPTAAVADPTVAPDAPPPSDLTAKTAGMATRAPRSRPGRAALVRPAPRSIRPRVVRGTGRPTAQGHWSRPAATPRRVPPVRR